MVEQPSHAVHRTHRIMEPNPVRPLEAARAMRALIADPEDTAQVFRVIRSLSGQSFERLFTRVMADPTGRRILEERRSLLPVLCDRDRLRAMPEGSLGREYARFMDAERITADGLEAASAYDKVDFYDDRARCLSDRLRDMHDLWHVVTGYGRDLLGEEALLGFTYAQLRNRGVGFIVLVGCLKMASEGHREVFGVTRQAYRRGKRAAFFAAADWEALLEEPLATVRRKLRIDDPPRYVPVWAEDAAAAAA